MVNSLINSDVSRYKHLSENVVVTGATGFIGRHLVPYLHSRGMAITSLSVRYGAKLKTEQAASSACFEEGSSVVHLAGLAHITQAHCAAAKERGEYKQANCDLAVHMAQRAIELKAKLFIYFSSVKAVKYNPAHVENTEAEQDAANDVYGHSKWQAEQSLRALEWSNTRLIIVRPCLVYGPEVKANMASLLRGAKRGWLPYINGGEPRSMVAIDNVCRAIELLVCAKQLSQDTYIISDAKTYTIDGIIRAAKAVAGGVQNPITLQVKSIRRIVELGQALSWLPNSSLGFPNDEWLDKLFAREVYSSQALQQDLDWRAERCLLDHLPLMLGSL